MRVGYRSGVQTGGATIHTRRKYSLTMLTSRSDGMGRKIIHGVGAFGESEKKKI